VGKEKGSDGRRSPGKMGWGTSAFALDRKGIILFFAAHTKE
jgi:hypothetical protein